MTKRLVKCPRCGDNVREDRLRKHISKVHDSPHKKYTPKIFNQSKIKEQHSSEWTTDESGVVITMQQYAEIHGETQRDRQGFKRMRNIKPVIKSSVPDNIFEKIANMPEKKSYSKNKYKLLAICKYCGIGLFETQMENHIEKIHGKSPKLGKTHFMYDSKKDPPVMRCRYCGAMVRKDRIKKHDQDLHGDLIKNRRKLNPSRSKKNKDSQSTHHHIKKDNNEGTMAEAFRRAYNQQEKNQKNNNPRDP